MIGLYLVAAHMTGDFLFQNRWHSARKFDDSWERFLHVTWYTVPFVPVAFIYAPWRLAVVFLALLFGLHYLTDSRRYLSTIGDVLGWRIRNEFGTRAARIAEWSARTGGQIPLGTRYNQTPPNPWPPMPLMIDQTLHVIQLAVLGGLFLT